MIKFYKIVNATIHIFQSTILSVITLILKLLPILFLTVLLQIIKKYKLSFKNQKLLDHVTYQHKGGGGLKYLNRLYKMLELKCIFHENNI